MHLLTSLELFAGAGGLALGVARAGYDHIVVNEIDANACATLRSNSQWPVVEADSRTVAWSQYEGQVSLLAAGAPCQPFSVGGQSLGQDDERDMFPELVRAVREVRPEAVIVENVRGLCREVFRDYLQYVLDSLAYPSVTPRSRAPWDSQRKRLASAKRRHLPEYWVYGPTVLNAANFGVPQLRERVFIVAFRADLVSEDIWRWPDATHSRDALLWSQIHGGYWSEHGLRRRKVAIGNRGRSRALVERLLQSEEVEGLRWQTVRDSMVGLPDPRSRTALNVSGHDYVGTTASLYPGHTGNELDWPAKTVKAGVHGVPGGEGIVILDRGHGRRLTVRETARLQSFPDTWDLVGASSQRMRQLGNAVPVKVAETLAVAVKKVLMSERVNRV